MTTNTYPILSKKEVTNIQVMVATLLYYAQGINKTVLVTLHDLGTVQAKPTKQTWYITDILLYYMAMNPEKNRNSLQITRFYELTLM